MASAAGSQSPPGSGSVAPGPPPGPAPGPPPMMPGPPPRFGGGPPPGAAPGPPPPLPPGPPPPPTGPSLHQIPSRSALPPPPSGGPGNSIASDEAFSSKDEAERAFIDLLRQKGVTVKWTWEDTIRHIVTEPMYKALKTLSERKAAFGKYIRELQEAEEKAKRDRVEQLLPLWRELIQTHGKAPDGTGEAKVKVYTSFDTAEKWFSGLKQWNAAASREEAKELYAIVQKELREKEDAFDREIRHRNMDMLMSLFKTFEADVFTTWADAQRTALSSEEFQSDEYLGSMDPTDMLIVWEEHVKSVEKVESDRLKKAAETEQAQARKNRQAFVELLRELRDQGAIKAGAQWGTVYKSIAQDERLIAMLGQPGSTPLELFFDVVDELDAVLDERVAQLEEVLKAKGFRPADVLPDAADIAEPKAVAELAGFEKAVEGEHSLSSAEVAEVYDEIKRRVREDQARARHRAERRLRHAIDELRYEMKRLDFTAEELEKSYEDILPRLEAECPEFQAEKDEAVRRGAWEKFVRRAKEKAEERRERYRDHQDHRDRDRTRDRSEEGHSGRKRKEPPADNLADSPRANRRLATSTTRESRSRSPAAASASLGANGGPGSGAGAAAAPFGGGGTGRRPDRDRAARRSGI
ncbi:hypothetical protein V8E36_008224 [Tilletia maclaganii]